MSVSQTTRVVRRVMLHFADVAPTGARARRGARARNARAERTKPPRGCFRADAPTAGAATRRAGTARRRAEGDSASRQNRVLRRRTQKKKKKTCSSRRARLIAPRRGAGVVDRRPRARRATRSTTRTRTRARRPRRREPTDAPSGRRLGRPAASATSAEGKQTTHASDDREEKKISSLLPAFARALVARRTRNGFPTRKRTLERSIARPPPARADASLGVSFAPRDGALGGRARARRRVGEGVASRRARTNKINPRRRRGRAPSLAVTGSAWAPRFAAGVSSFGAWVRTGGSGVSAARPWGWDGGNARRRRRRRWSNDGERWRKIARGRLRRRRGRTGGAVDAVAGAVALGASDFTSDGGFASKSARVRGVGMSGTAENRASRRVVETREAA